jgi:hypothetical protein
MTAHQNYAFHRLLSAWRQREELRSSGNVSELSAARDHLDAARLDSRSVLQSLR